MYPQSQQLAGKSTNGSFPILLVSNHRGHPVEYYGTKKSNKNVTCSMPHSWTPELTFRLNGGSRLRIRHYDVSIDTHSHTGTVQISSLEAPSTAPLVNPFSIEFCKTMRSRGAGEGCEDDDRPTAPPVDRCALRALLHPPPPPRRLCSPTDGGRDGGRDGRQGKTERQQERAAFVYRGSLCRGYNSG